jgi:hypothetical protein
VPILFTLAGAAIVINQFYANPWNALAATGVLALGVPVYLFWNWRRKA